MNEYGSILIRPSVLQTNLHFRNILKLPAVTLWHVCLWRLTWTWTFNSSSSCLSLTLPPQLEGSSVLDTMSLWIHSSSSSLFQVFLISLTTSIPHHCDKSRLNWILQRASGYIQVQIYLFSSACRISHTSSIPHHHDKAHRYSIRWASGYHLIRVHSPILIFIQYDLIWLILHPSNLKFSPFWVQVDIIKPVSTPVFGVFVSLIC